PEPAAQAQLEPTGRQQCAPAAKDRRIAADPLTSANCLDKIDCVYRLSIARSDMSVEKPQPVPTPCFCNALRQASRAVSRLYDEELRGVGLRTTQYSLLTLLGRAGEVRQRELSGQTLLDETTLTRALRPLVEGGWVAVRTGEDRRERLVAITAAGAAKLEQA